MGSKLGSSAAADTGNRGRGRNFRTCMLELDSLQDSVVFVKEGPGSPFMPGQTALRICGRMNALCRSLSLAGIALRAGRQIEVVLHSHHS